jgi:hypothetical protein
MALFVAQHLARATRRSRRRKVAAVVPSKRSGSFDRRGQSLCRISRVASADHRRVAPSGLTPPMTAYHKNFGLLLGFLGIDQPAHQAWSQLHFNVLDMNDQRASRPRKFCFYGIHNFAGAENFAPTSDQASLTGAACALHLLGSD